MKKEAFLSLAVFFCLFLNGFGQTDSTVTFKETKNEIAINTMPALNFLMGGLPLVVNYSGIYKRKVTDKLYLRLGFSSTQNMSYYSSSSPIFAGFGAIAQSYNDTSMTILYEDYKYAPKELLHVGFEFELGEKKVKVIAGADLTFGNRTDTYLKYSEVYILDTVLVPGQITFVYAEFNNLESHFTAYNSFGVHGFLGMKYSFLKHWAVSTNLALDFLYSSGERTVIDGNNYVIGTEKVTTTDLDFYPIVSDVSLIYRF